LKIQKLGLLILVTGVLLSFASCGGDPSDIQSDGTNNPPEGGYYVTQYESAVPEFGRIALEYPEDWKLKEDITGADPRVLTLEVGSDREIIRFTMTHEDAFYEAFEESYTKSGVLITDSGVPATLYYDPAADSADIVRAFDYNPGTDTHEYYFAEILMSKEVYDANKDKVTNTLKSFKINGG